MQSLKYIILEKLKINNNSKSNHYKIMYNNICDYLCKWLCDKDTYKGIKNNRFEFLRQVDNNILNLFKCFQGELEEMSERLQIPIRDLIDFIEEDNDKLVKDAKKYYLEIYDILPF